MSIGTDTVERCVNSSAAGGAEFLSTPERLERCRELAQQGFLVARVAQTEDAIAIDDASGDPAARDLANERASREGLQQRLHAAIEIALAQRGAAPSTLDERADEQAWAHDQLARSRTVDAPGVCVVMPQVRADAADGLLSEADSFVLRSWRALAAVERVVLLFDESDAQISMLSPRSLAAVFGTGSQGAAGADDVVRGAFVAPDSGLVGEGACERAARNPVVASAVEPESTDEQRVGGRLGSVGAHLGFDLGDWGDSSEAAFDDEEGSFREACEAWESASDDVLGGTPAANDVQLGTSDPLARQHAATLGLLFEALLEEPAEDQTGWVLEPAPDSDMPTRRADDLEEEPFSQSGGRQTLHSADGLASFADAPAVDSSMLPEGSVFDAPSSPPPALADGWVSAPSSMPPSAADRSAPDSDAGRRARPPAPDPRSRGNAQGNRRRPPARKDTSRLGRAVMLDHDMCTRYARELDAAHGPQPVRTIEQIYRSRYVPLLETLSAGLEHEPARQALHGWSRTFAKSYVEGFTNIKLTGKRPPMVFDTPDLATRVARMHGAKGVELLLVDGLRFDLAQRAWRLVGARVGARAVCVEETLLWSALPTITPVQLKLLARGPGALKDLDLAGESDPLIHRDRSVTTLRRMRLGSRDLLKLDVVEARLRETGGPFDERMADLADIVADTAVELIATMPAGSLLYIFGDHGFRLPAGGADEGSHGLESTPPASQGGPSPEEVLTPAAAWLVGHGPDSSN